MGLEVGQNNILVSLTLELDQLHGVVHLGLMAADGSGVEVTVVVTSVSVILQHIAANKVQALCFHGGNVHLGIATVGHCLLSSLNQSITQLVLEIHNAGHIGLAQVGSRVGVAGRHDDVLLRHTSGLSHLGRKGISIRRADNIHAVVQDGLTVGAGDGSAGNIQIAQGTLGKTVHGAAVAGQRQAFLVRRDVHGSVAHLQLGSLGFRGLTGAVGGATGSHGKNHQNCQSQCNQFLYNILLKNYFFYYL